MNERAFLAAVLEAVEDSIVACDPDGVLTLFNRATRQLHGLPEQPLPACEWAAYYDLYRPDGRTPIPTAEIPLMRALGGEHIHNVDMMLVPKGGAPRSLQASGQSLCDPGGVKLGAVVSKHDVTAQRKADAARESQDDTQPVVRADPPASRFLLRPVAAAGRSTHTLSGSFLEAW